MKLLSKCVFAIAAFCFGYVVTPRSVALADEQPTTQPAEPWASQPPDKWPQLVLTNDASFEGHTPLKGASSFLMRMPDDEVLVGTAKHLIKKAGGVDPPLVVADLDAALKQWRVYPRTHAELAIEAKGRAITVNREAACDWLLLHLSDAHAKLPATPLTPRLTPAVVGETVYLIGVSYSDAKDAQHVYKGTVTARPSDHYFEYEFSPPVQIAGFSGAPIIDQNGLLLGHGVARSKLKQKDGLEVEFGGEDAVLALQLWRHRDDPPSVKALATLHLTLPEGWVAKAPLSKLSVQTAVNAEFGAEFDLIAQARTDVDDSIDLKEWSRRSKENSAKIGKLEDRKETELREGKIAGHATMEHEVSGTFNGVNLRYRMIMFEASGCFCKLICWTSPARWDAAQPKFEQLLEGLK